MLVGFVGKSSQRLLQRREPLAIVDQISIVHSQLLLQMQRILVHSDHLQLLVGKVENGAARCFVYAPVLHTDQTVFHNVEKSYAVLGA